MNEKKETARKAVKNGKAAKTPEKKRRKKTPLVEITSVSLYPCVELLGNESPDERFVYYTNEGADAFLNFKETYGFCFGIRFTADADPKDGVRTAFAGPVEIDIRSEDGKIGNDYVGETAPLKLVRRRGDGAGYTDGTYLFTNERNEETENLFENVYKNASGQLKIKSFVVANEDYSVYFDVTADFQMKDGSAEIGRSSMKVNEAAVFPNEYVIKEEGEQS